MIIGIGIDIIELTRIEKVLERQERFAERILTKVELKKYELLTGKRRVEFLSGRFAAKEAYVKALGTGISKEYGWKDIEIANDDRGKPFINTKINEVVHLSISHSKDYAVAQVIIESLSS